MITEECTVLKAQCLLLNCSPENLYQFTLQGNGHSFLYLLRLLDTYYLMVVVLGAGNIVVSRMDSHIGLRKLKF